MEKQLQFSRRFRILLPGEPIAERKWIHMKQFLPREKMSKREKRALDATKRASWDGVNPVTRKVESKKTYDRKRSPRWYNDDSTGIFVCL